VRRSVALLTLLCWISIPRARAQRDPAIQHESERASLELEQVLHSVRTHHPLLLAERATLARSQAEQLAARGEFDAVLTAQARGAALGYYDPRRLDVALEQPTPLLGLTAYGGYRITRGKVAPYYGEQNTLDRGELRGGVRLPLLQGLRTDSRRAGVRVSDAEARAAGHALDELVLDLARDGAGAYFAWAAAGQRMRVLDELVALARFRDEQIRTKVALGALPRIEQLDNQRSLLERERQLVGARRSFEKASFDLSLYLRDEQGRPRVALASEVPVEHVREAPFGTRERAERAALAQRPELKAYARRLEAAQVERELAGNQVRPRLDAFAEVSRDFGEADSALERTLRPTVLEVGATFSLPLWLRKARGKLRSAEAKLRALEEKARFAEDKVQAEVRDAWSQLDAARERAELARRTADLALQVAAGERERFELGATTVLFVNLREQSAADAQMALFDAAAELGFSTIRVLTVMGESP
jgi:outer membrane protein, heavy metal efflux system